jgi:hypothetical protein
MARAVPIWYTITQSFRGGVKGNDKFYYVRDFGDFFSIIDFSIIPKGIDGIIFQKITKITSVIFNINSKETLLDTTKTILDHTNQNVDFTNETYLEYFEVKNSNVGGDQFQNSAITRYIKKNVDFKNVSNYGIILQKGECVFIPSNHPQYNTIKGYGWKKAKTHASNGLNFFDDTCTPLGTMNALWGIITKAKQSNIVCHTVEYYWKKDPLDNENSINVFVERINKNVTDIKKYFVNYNNIHKVKNIVDKMHKNQESKNNNMIRQHSINTRIEFVAPMVAKTVVNPGVVKRIGSKPVLIFPTRIKPSAIAKAKAVTSSSAKAKAVTSSSARKSSRKTIKFINNPGGGTIKSKKRRQTVKNRKKHNRKTVKRRKIT